MKKEAHSNRLAPMSRRRTVQKANVPEKTLQARKTSGADCASTCTGLYFGTEKLESDRDEPFSRESGSLQDKTCP